MTKPPKTIHLTNEELKQAVNEWLAKNHPEIKIKPEWSVHPLSPLSSHLIQVEVES